VKENTEYFGIFKIFSLSIWNLQNELMIPAPCVEVAPIPQ
jgi:hypothetical protein